MIARDLQSFVEQLDERGWLHRVAAPVSPILELAAITDQVTKAGGPALLFENVTGSRIPVLINTFGTQERMCLALGADSFTDVADRVQQIIKPEIPTTLMEKLKKIPQLAQLGSLPPKVVRRGICQEVVHTDTANLFDLPIIKCWLRDGDPAYFNPQHVAPPTDGEPGRYITLGAIFTKNPENQDRNIGMYRVQVFGPKHAAMHWHMHHDGARHYRMYKRRNERMPVAIALGGPALMPYAATCPLPPGIEETLFAGFLLGKSVELVPCVTQPQIEVPSAAEIVIEGYIDPEEPTILEGPFGDHTGFYSLPDQFPQLHVTAITHRQNPIYPTTIVGKPPQEDYWLGKATERIFLPLLQMLVPDIIDYNLPMFGCFHNCAFVKIRKEYPLQARRVMSAIWGAGQMAFTKIIVVVDEHVDVHNEDEVLFHVCSNVDPKRDLTLVDGPVDILDHASLDVGVGSKLGIDATKKIPGEGQIRPWPEELAIDDATLAQIRSRWSEYGLDPEILNRARDFNRPEEMPKA